MKQEEVLLTFAQGEDGQAWAASLFGWSLTSGVDCCDWFGIQCELGDGDITSILLSDSDLLGTIPPELGYLKKLKTLNISRNIIMGDIPLAVANLPALEVFDARDNQLSGPLPKFTSSKLRILAFENNHLSQSLPENFGEGHPDMIDFNVVNNDLSGTIPSSISQLTKLTWLQLSENHFYGSIPSGIGKMRNLKFLYLNRNNFMGEIPRELSQSGSVLTEVWLHNNLLSGTVPAAFAEIPTLKNLYVDGNKFTGVLPVDLCKPQINSDFFDEFDVAAEDRDYCESIACPASYSSLEGVWPCEPCPSGEINPFLGLEGSCFPTDQTRILRQLFEAMGGENWSVDGNKWFTPQVKVCEFAGITCNANGYVTRIELSDKNLEGTIPSSIGFLEHLDTLDLSRNKLQGFIPSDLRFAPLVNLDISGNQLIGIVPPKLCMKGINGNGIDGAFRCDLIACPQGTYSNTGIADDDRTCEPCNDAENYILGKTQCGPEVASGATFIGFTGSSSTAMSPGLVAFIVIIVLASVFFLGFAIYKYRKTLKEDSFDEQELKEFDLSENNYDFPSSYPSMPPPSSHSNDLFPDQVVIEEMDDDFSSITRIRKKKSKRKKKKQSSSDSVVSEERSESRSGDANPLWLDVPRLEHSSQSSQSPHELT